MSYDFNLLNIEILNAIFLLFRLQNYKIDMKMMYSMLFCCFYF